MAEQLLDHSEAEMNTLEELRAAVQEIGFAAVMDGVLKIEEAVSVD